METKPKECGLCRTCAVKAGWTLPLWSPVPVRCARCGAVGQTYGRGS
jgi:hypothetical protein